MINKAKVFFLLLGLVLCFVSPVKADWDLHIAITFTHVDAESDFPPVLNAPDPYIKIGLFPSEDVPPVIILGQSPTIMGQPVCTAPHMGAGFVVPHVQIPFIFAWQVWDKDLIFDDIMTGGVGVGTPMNGPPWVFGSAGPTFSITFTITAVLSECGSNVTYSKRSYSHTPGLNETLPVLLELHVDETTSPGMVTVYEHIPKGYTYLDADPIPSSVNSLSDAEGFSGTELVWEFPSPASGDLDINYNVITPGVEHELSESFGSYIVQDDSVMYCALAGNRISPVVGQDCNENGLDDFEEIVLHPARDKNLNAVLDECEGIPVPSLTEWGAITLILLLVAAGIWVMLRRRRLEPMRS